jgi:hypothetical protein
MVSTTVRYAFDILLPKLRRLRLRSFRFPARDRDFLLKVFDFFFRLLTDNLRFFRAMATPQDFVRMKA